MTNEVVFWLLVITIFAFSLSLAFGIRSLIDRIEAVINILKHMQEDR